MIVINILKKLNNLNGNWHFNYALNMVDTNCKRIGQQSPSNMHVAYHFNTSPLSPISIRDSVPISVNVEENITHFAHSEIPSTALEKL